MPTAVTHLLVPLFLVALFRDYFVKKRGRFPLHYALIAGLGGVLPDIDLLIFFVLGYFSFTLEQIHRTITHSLLASGFFVILSIITVPLKNRVLGRHKLKIHWIFLALAFGFFIHTSLDGILSGEIRPLSPFSDYEFSLNLIQYAPEHMDGLVMPLFEGFLLVFWIAYLEIKHKISDFI